MREAKSIIMGKTMSENRQPYGAKEPPKREEIFTPFSELCRYADEYHMIVELEKPFSEFDEIFLRVLDEEDNEIYKITLGDIASLDEEAGKVLNELSKNKRK